MTRTILILPFLLVACGQQPSSTDDPGRTSPELIATAKNDSFHAELLSPGQLRVGRNLVSYRVATLDGAPVENATLAHETTMHMHMDDHAHSHSSPSVDPDAGGQGEIIFTMASDDHGTWDVVLTVSVPGEEPSVLTFVSVPVAESDARKDLVVDDRQYIVTLNFDAPVKVGHNPFVLTVHEVGEHDFMAQTALDVTFTPDMPTMGHGSPGNVQPSHGANGNYSGSVNLTMPGLWHLDFVVGELGPVRYVVDF